MKCFVARLWFASAIAGVVSLASVAAAADPAEIDWPATEEQAAVRAIAAWFETVDDVKRRPDGSLERVSLSGRGGKKGSMRIVFDPDSQRVVSIHGNSVGVKNDEFAAFAPLTELTTLSLHHNKCPGLDREGLATHCDGAGLALLKGNAALEEIAMPGGRFDNEGLAAVAKLPQLKRLVVSHVRAQDAGFAALRNHPGLESVAVSPQYGSHISDATIEHLSHCPNLRELRFNEGYVTWENGLRHLTNLQGTFETLNLGRSLVAPEDLDRFRSEMPGVDVLHAGLPEIGATIASARERDVRKLRKLAPQKLLDRYVAAANAAE